MISRHQPAVGRRSHRGGARAAFTLLEVILAIVIATGILVVAMHFYNQSARLRGELIRQSEQFTAVRLLLDRLAADLRTARADAPAAFTGDLTSMQFAHTDLPQSALRSPSQGRGFVPESDLRWVSYSARSFLEGTNRTLHGVSRLDEALLDTRHLGAATPVSTNVVLATGSSDVASTNRPPEPFATEVRFLRFSYWDGQAWADSWKSSELPQAVEVSVGLDALPEGTDPIEYPGELFRRIVLLPGGGLGRRGVAQAPTPGAAAAPAGGGTP